MIPQGYALDRAGAQDRKITWHCLGLTRSEQIIRSPPGGTTDQFAPGAKHRFLVGFLKEGRAAVRTGGFDQAADLRECARCGQPTTGELCAYCRMAERGRKKALQKDVRYGRQQTVEAD